MKNVEEMKEQIQIKLQTSTRKARQNGNNFVEGKNTVTLEKATGDWQVGMLDKVISGLFTLHFHINHMEGTDLCIGVVDRLAKHGRNYIQSQNGVKYDGCGTIEYGSGEGHYEKEYTNDCLK